MSGTVEQQRLRRHLVQQAQTLRQIAEKTTDEDARAKLLSLVQDFESDIEDFIDNEESQRRNSK